ncbi:L,D-transpeptidase family protein [Geotalea uraniireducens]|uniref:ErfK/YbiS/YcfS/YnhG family protein n=1 Tax=Geotalea uraniireducens (strain Rf4) TaxID=351605 RepID=A5G8V1_GEOUR|nr:L,D-transpeptidase family protein [Geotalea uraniireducens]ABQ28219.1 ErfK/YbiS/YcfS/YnhG family protein [Geotalea uraniireducens Rf4]
MRFALQYLAASAFLLILSCAALAEVYSGDATVIGIRKSYRTRAGESLVEVARRFDLGYQELVAANPGIDPFAPGAGISVTIPTEWIVPASLKWGGIVINLSEMRLYYSFSFKGARLIASFPIGIGDEGKDTPVGTFRVIQKIENPSWYVPQSVKMEKPELPDVVPPGPDNPLGTHAMRLSERTILIHGTNKPWGVGRRVSHGCIRLYPEDIPRLYRLVAVGTPVTIVMEPVKVGERNGRVFAEVHDDRSSSAENIEAAVTLLNENILQDRISTKKLLRAIMEKKGVPVDISR